MEAFCCHGNQSLDPICPKTLCSLSPNPVMLHIKFDQDWPTGFRDIQVWKCGRRTTTTDDDDGRRTDDGPLVYYKLTLWAFGSGELKTMKTSRVYELSGQPSYIHLFSLPNKMPTYFALIDRHEYYLKLPKFYYKLMWNKKDDCPILLLV